MQISVIKGFRTTPVPLFSQTLAQSKLILIISQHNGAVRTSELDRSKIQSKSAKPT